LKASEAKLEALSVWKIDSQILTVQQLVVEVIRFLVVSNGLLKKIILELHKVQWAA
jgi:hypothetical protein